MLDEPNLQITNHFRPGSLVQVGDFQYTEAGIVGMNKQQFNNILQVFTEMLNFIRYY